MTVADFEARVATWPHLTADGDVAEHEHAEVTQVTGDVAQVASRARSTARGRVALSFDDGWETAWSVVRPAAQERGHKYAFFIDSAGIDQASRLTAAQIKTLHDEGHEIGAHSVTHANLTGLTAAQRVVEYEDCNDALEAITGVRPATFAYPFGSAGRNDTTDQELWLRHQAAFSTATSLGQYRADTPEVFVPLRMLWTSANHLRVMELVRAIAASPRVLHLYTHSPGTEHGGDNPSVPQFHELLDLFDSAGVATVLPSEVVGVQYPLTNPGFELPVTEGWTRVASSGTQIAESVVDAPAAGLPGTRSLRLATDDPGAFVFVRQTIPVVPGRAYTYSARVRTAITSGTGGVRLRLDAVNRNAGSVGGPTNGAIITDGEWTRHTLNYTAPADAPFVNVDCMILTAAGQAWFDHLHFGEQAFGSFG